MPLPGQAKTLLQHREIEQLITTEATFAEVQEYAVLLPQKKRLSLDALLLAMAALPVSIVERALYAPALPEARKLIAKGDPDDVEIFALALHAGIPLWSNDSGWKRSALNPAPHIKM